MEIPQPCAVLLSVTKPQGPESGLEAGRGKDDDEDGNRDDHDDDYLRRTTVVLQVFLNERHEIDMKRASIRS